MSFATDKWFQHIRVELLTEGLSDIGLSDNAVQRIQMELPRASEKGRVWVGNAIKSYALLGHSRDRFINKYEDFSQDYKDYFQHKDFNILENYAKVFFEGLYGEWQKARKTFLKSSNKFNVPSEIIDKFLEIVDYTEGVVISDFMARIENVILTLNGGPKNYEMSILYKETITTEKGRKKRIYMKLSDIPPSDWSYAEEKCEDYQINLEDEDFIIHRFKDGSFWYNLQSPRCEIEQVRMGHCGDSEAGGGGGGDLFSLRKREKDSPISESFVTIAFREDDKTITQIKGRYNSCPPQDLWEHIQTFIEISGARTLEEYGQYSSEPEEFGQLGEWLADRTGIYFGGSLDKRVEEFKEEIREYENDWQSTEYFQQIDYGGVTVDTLEGADDLEAPLWYSSVDSIASKLPFDLSERLILAVYGIGSDESEDLPDVDVDEEVLEIIGKEDRSSILENAWPHSVYFIKADNYEQAFLKANNTSRLIREDPDQFLEGSESYIILWGVRDLFDEYADEELNKFEAYDFSQWCTVINNFVDDLEDSIDEIEEFLVSERLIEPNQVDALKTKIDEEFNNFVVSTKLKGRGEYLISSSALLLKTTAAEMETIVDLGFFDDFYKTNSAFYSNEEFKTLVVEKLAQKEAQAVKFAKNQMKLNFGEKYEEKIESIWDKINSSNTIKKSFYDEMFAGFQPQIPEKVNNPEVAQTLQNQSAFYYKFEILLNNQTIEFFGPFLEYYDNNFELVTGAFEFALKKMISEKAQSYKKQRDSDTNLPVSEARANPLDVRLYEIDFVMSYPLNKGFEMTDIHNIIRAIPDVTTVRTIGEKKRTQANRIISLQRLKFALQGQKNRMEWVKQILLPQIHKISHEIRIHKVEQADLVSNSKQRLEEYYAAFSQRPSAPRTTPRPTIQGLIDDWVEGGVMYDQPTNINLTRYSVMMPVADLEHLCGREARKHGHHFDAGYENFVKNGPRDPIYLAIGKNGRAKITGNEDDLRYAIKAGVEEVPVFISYQRQV